jgi:hypothetical protein
LFLLWYLVRWERGEGEEKLGFVLFDLRTNEERGAAYELLKLKFTVIKDEGPIYGYCMNY